MAHRYSILIIGSDREAMELIGKSLDSRSYFARLASSIDEGVRIHREEGCDLVLVMLPLQDGSGVELVKRLKAQEPRGIFVIAGRDEQIKGAPEAMELGAFDYLSNPAQDPDRLLTIVGIGLGVRKSDAQLRFLRMKDAMGAGWETMIGQCPDMRRIYSSVRNICHRTMRGVAPTILVTGETGTGKGLMAKMIHYNSCRRSGALVDINCAAIPPALVESELFGHTRGAFTDARISRPGLFETADGGTLFLDEIGALPLELQGKLLTAIEEKIVRRIGASVGIPVDVQVIAATHRELETLVQKELFRPDLFHRLNVIRIDLPPLRQRGEDRVLLATAFMRQLCQKYGRPVKRLSVDACQLIDEYGWPGNVRELRNQIERIVMLEDAEVIHARHFTLKDQGGIRVQKEGGGLVVELPEDSCPLDALEREVIRQAVEKLQGNISHAARYLGVTRHTLMYRMKKHGLEAWAAGHKART